jgi:hypothetical protein
MFGDAEAYDRFMGRWSHLVAPLLVDFTGLPGTGRVLDVGSGTLREVRRVTKAACPISAAVWDYGAGMRMLRVFWDAAVSTDARAERLDEKHMPLCRAGDLSELWRRGGLESVHEEPLDITMRFESFADYWDPFLLGQGPAGSYVRSIDHDRSQVLRDAVKRGLSIPREDVPFALPARVWAVRGIVPIRF